MGTVTPLTPRAPEYGSLAWCLKTLDLGDPLLTAIVQAVCKEWTVWPEQLLGRARAHPAVSNPDDPPVSTGHTLQPSQKGHVAMARHFCWFLATRYRPNMPASQIGEVLGGYSASAVRSWGGSDVVRLADKSRLPLEQTSDAIERLSNWINQRRPSESELADRQVEVWQRDGHWLEVYLSSENGSDGLAIQLGCPSGRDPTALCRRPELASSRTDCGYDDPCWVVNARSFLATVWTNHNQTPVTGRMPLEWREVPDTQNDDEGWYAIEIRSIATTSLT